MLNLPREKRFHKLPTHKKDYKRHLICVAQRTKKIFHVFVLKVPLSVGEKFSIGRRIFESFGDAHCTAKHTITS
jgi:hypothetical protein